jgi:FO synthase
MPHHGSPDKVPQRRIATLEEAGKQQVPFTTGILIGIGETREERIQSLLEIRKLHDQYGHIQEIIIQNFRAKPGTLMATAPEPDLNELLWTLAMARLIFGAEMAIQAPPNLSPGVLPQIINAGINDWGGVSPLTPDYVNPEAPWPHLEQLSRETAIAGKQLEERLTIYPDYAMNPARWTDKRFHQDLLARTDAQGFPRTDAWLTGSSHTPPADIVNGINTTSTRTLSQDVKAILHKADRGYQLEADDISRLFAARGDDFSAICQQANALREDIVGDTVTYVVNRNINYTNICYFKCQFCAFSKGKTHEHLRGKPYNISLEEIQNRTREAVFRGATEVCMQGGIHPDYTGQQYLDICRAVKQVAPHMHIHAFSPLEIYQGANTLGISVRTFLQQLKEAGLSTLPGTAAEILHDDVRNIICPDKINTAQWLEVIETAHNLGIKTTSTIMFGHVDHYHHWAEHLIQLRELQQRTGGLTEFVPLPFVGAEAPIFKRGRSRQGPTFRESILMHAVARIVFGELVPNIQASWVKLGTEGVVAKSCRRYPRTGTECRNP